MLSEAIQGKYILGKQSVVGDPRRKYEDRAYSGEIKRHDGSSLIVAIIADGVGSADFGSRGAQLAIDKTIEMLERSKGGNIPIILKKTIEIANTAVYEDNEAHDGDGLSTLTIAAVYNDRCYVANVGDSRAYWVQNGKMLQLTRDHTYYNFYGGLPTDPNADVVVNAIGKNAEVQVDLGLYLKGDDPAQANRLGKAGLPLKPGDSIIVCSDGLIKVNPQTKERYAKDEEIIEALGSEFSPNKSAIKIVSTAEGRRPDDNVSATTIQYISDEVVKAAQTRINKEKNAVIYKRAGIGVTGLAIFLLFAFWISQTTGRPNVVILPTNTPQPTYTPYPTLAQANSIFIEGDEAIVYGQMTSFQNTQDLIGKSLVTVANGSTIEITKATNIFLADGSRLYVESGTRLILQRIETEKDVILEQGALLVKLNTGSIVVRHINGLNAQVTGSVMGVSLSQENPDLFFVDCYEGHCVVRGGASGDVPIDAFNVDNRNFAFSSQGIDVTDIYERCQFWNSLFGADVVGSLGVACVETPPTPTPKPPSPDTSTGGKHPNSN